MFRTVTCVSLLSLFMASAAEAQITSVPVVTTWPAQVRVVNYPPVVAPVASCNSCATGPVTVAAPVVVAPVTTFYAPPVAVPVVTYAQPTTAWRWPFTARYRPSVTYVVPPPVVMPAVAYYNPISTYRMPTPPDVVVTAPVVAAPTTTYYAPTLASPAVTGPAVVPAPAPVSSGCGCSGR